MNERVQAILEVVGANEFVSKMNQAKDSVSGMKDQTQESGGILKRAGSMVSGFMGSVTKMASAIGITKLVGAGFNLIRDSVGQAVARVDTLNQFPRVMEMMGFSADDAERAVSNLSTGIEGLPTKLDDIVANAQNIGILTGDLDGATATALALNNAFLASGSSSADASRGLTQYVQMLSRGEVDMQSWRSLQETMGPALRQTAEAFGFAGESAQNDLYDALKDGEITFNDFNDKIIELSNETGGFADQAREASRGIATSMQNIRTAISRNVANAIQIVDEAMQANGFGSIADNLDRVKGLVDIAFGGINNAIQTFLNWVGRMYAEIRESTAWATFTQVISMAREYVQQLWQTFKDTGALDTVRDLLNRVWEAILNINFVEVIQQVSDFIERWSPLILGITGAIVAFQALSTIIPIVVGAFKAFSIIKTLISTVGLLQTGLTFLAPVIGALNLPLLAVVAVIGAVIAIGVLLYKNWDTIRERAIQLGQRISETWNNIKEWTSNAWSGIVEYLTGVWEGIVTAVSDGLNRVREWFTNIWDSITTITSNAWNSLTEYLSGIWTSIVGIASSVWNEIVAIFDMVWGVIQTITSVAWEVIKGIIFVAIGLVYTIISTQINAIRTVIETVWNVISTVTSTVWDFISNIISTVWDSIWSFIQPTVESIQSLISTAWNAISTVTSTVWNTIKNAIQTVLTVVGTVISNAWNKYLTVVTSYLDRIKGIIQTVWNAIKSVIETVMNAIRSVVTTVWNAVLSAITTAVNAIRSVVTSVWNAISSVISSVLNAIRSTAQSVWNSIRSIITGVVNGIRSVITSVWNSIRSTISSVMNAIMSVISSIWNSIRNTTSSIVNSIRSTISNIFNSLRGIVSNAFNAVRNAVSNGMSRAYQAVVNKVKDFYNAGRNIVTSIAEGITGAISKVTGAIGKVTSKIRDFLPFSPAEEGALRDINKLDFHNPITDSLYRGERAIQKAMNDILTLPDVGSNIDLGMEEAERQLNGKVKHNVSLNERKRQPTQVNLTIGGKVYRAFVEDISNQQGEEADLHEAF